MERWKREVVMVDPKKLIPHPRRDEGGPRFDTKEALENLPMNLAALQADLLANGIELPLLVQEGTNILITGHFRRTVALQADWTEVPVHFLSITDEDAYEMMMQDNWKRNDRLSQDRLAVARNVKLVVERYKLAKEITGVHAVDSDIKKNILDLDKAIVDLLRKHFNISKSLIYDYLSLLNLVPELQVLSSENRMGMRASVKVSKLEPEVQAEFYKRFGEEERITDSMVDLFLAQWEVAVASANSLVRVEVNEQAQALAENAAQKKPGAAKKAGSKDVAVDQPTAQLTIPLDEQNSDTPVYPKLIDQILEEDPGKKEQIKQTALEHLDDLDSMVRMNVRRFDTTVSRVLQTMERQFTDLNKAWTNEVMDHYGTPHERGFVHNTEVRALQRKAHQIADLMDAIVSMKHYVPDEIEAKG